MPYKLFLVEDEVVTRDGIRSSVDWSSAGFQWCGEAPDGELALAMVEADPPDILITDIKMPFMDGLELSRIVRGRFPQIRIVILSGHDEFRFAQEAIQLGVTEYLLKPIGAQELLAALARICTQIDQERMQTEHLTNLQNRLDDNLNVLRQRFLVDLVTGRFSSSAAVDEARRMGVDLVARSYLALIVRCQVVGEMPHLARLEAYHSVRQRVADFLSGRDDVLVFVKDVEETGVIVKGETPSAVQTAAERLTQQLTLLLRDDSPLVIGIGAGRIAQRLAELPQSFLDAFDAAKAQTGRTMANPPRFVFPPKQLLALDPIAVIAFLRRGDLQGIDAFLDVHLASVHHDDPELSTMIEFLVTDLLVAISSFAQELGGVLEEVIPGRAELESLVAEGDSVSTLRVLMRRLLTQTLVYRDRHTDRTRQLIEHAKSYLQEHLTSDDISLHTVAAEVGWSPSHLSAVFSRATGETFIEYLTKLRIQKARDLLRMTALPTAEIGFQVGYSNPRYFYAVFKKVTGQSPTDFRQERSVVAADPPQGAGQ